MANISGEKRYEQVFGETFALYTQKEMLEFIEPFKVRFEKNGLDARKIFAGKTCFDAACGNGRGALFMLMNGAKHVTCCDFSEINVQTTRANLKKFGFDNGEAFVSSLESIDRPDESFDFVWCNGVIMHTAHPNRCLNEITRLLKVGGQSWIYVYGSGGAYWRSVEHFREMLKDVNVRDCIATLQLLRYETRYVAEFIDDWFATHLRSYTHADFGRALIDAGFAPTQPLPYGMAYDTSHRRYTYGAAEMDAMGEGDLRYLLDKAKPTPKKEAPILDEGEYGSSFDWPPAITQGVDAAMAKLKSACPQKWQRIAAAAHIQRDLRLQMTEPQAFDLTRYLALVERVTAQAAATGTL
jgi:ubiquinone/menaquinone biosynthesis C-methylase UbiE